MAEAENATPTPAPTSAPSRWQGGIRPNLRLLTQFGGLLALPMAVVQVHALLQPSSLSLYVAKRLDYVLLEESACGWSHAEIFVVPMTIANEGGRIGIVKNIKMRVRPVKTGAKQPAREFEATNIGVWRSARGGCVDQEDIMHFTPFHVKPGEAFRDSIIFSVSGGAMKILTTSGVYAFTFEIEQIASGRFGGLYSTTSTMTHPERRELRNSVAAGKVISLIPPAETPKD